MSEDNSAQLERNQGSTTPSTEKNYKPISPRELQSLRTNLNAVLRKSGSKMALANFLSNEGVWNGSSPRANFQKMYTLLSGKRKSAHYYEVEKMAKFLGCTTVELLAPTSRNQRTGKNLKKNTKPSVLQERVRAPRTGKAIYFGLSAPEQEIIMQAAKVLTDLPPSERLKLAKKIFFFANALLEE